MHFINISFENFLKDFNILQHGFYKYLTYGCFHIISLAIASLYRITIQRPQDSKTNYCSVSFHATFVATLILSLRVFDVNC